MFKYFFQSQLYINLIPMTLQINQFNSFLRSKAFFGLPLKQKSWSAQRRMEKERKGKNEKKIYILRNIKFHVQHHTFVRILQVAKFQGT